MKFIKKKKLDYIPFEEWYGRKRGCIAFVRFMKNGGSQIDHRYWFEIFNTKEGWSFNSTANGLVYHWNEFDKCCQDAEKAIDQHYKTIRQVK